MFVERYTEGSYLEHAPDWHEGEAAWKAGKVHGLVAKHRLEPRTVVDVGCGSGEVLRRLMLRLGPQAEFTGYDIAPQAIALAQRKAGPRLRFVEGDFLSAGASSPVDLLLCLDVFEHVPNYLDFLRALSRSSQRFIFHIPLDCCLTGVLRGSGHELSMRQDFGHLHYFTRETALATLGDTGYRVLDVETTWDHEMDRLTPRDWLKRPLPSIARAADMAMFRWKPALAARLRPHFNALVLAERSG